MQSVRWSRSAKLTHASRAADFRGAPTTAFARSVEDPVARHDARECGTFMCARMPAAATAYIQAGCVGSFADFVDAFDASVSTAAVTASLASAGAAPAAASNAVVAAAAAVATTVGAAVGFVFARQR